MHAIKAIIRNGRIETDEPIGLPDGTELFVSLANSSINEEEGWDNSPEAITEWLRWYDSLQPLKLSATEETETDLWLKQCMHQIPGLVVENWRNK